MTTTFTLAQGQPYLWTNMSQALFAQGTLSIDGDGNVVISLDNYVDPQDGLAIPHISMVLAGTDLSIDGGDNLLTSGTVTSGTLYADGDLVATIGYGSVFPTADQMNAVFEAWRADPFDLNAAFTAEDAAVFNDNMVFTGSSGNDIVLTGFDGHNSTIDAGAGNDMILAEAGNDQIDAGTGDDTVNGGDGNDTINGGNDNDSIDGGAGNDNIFGGDGNDHIDGGDGSDFINGGAGNDTLIGGDASDFSDDFFVGGAGDDLIIGGQHTNEANRVQYRWEGGPNGVIVNLSSQAVSGIGPVDGQTATSIGAGTALDSFGGTDTFEHVQNVDGTSHGDFIVSSDEGSDLAGYEGNDTFVAGSGWDDVDYFNETRGNDIDGTRGVIVNLGGDPLTVTGDMASATGQEAGTLASDLGLDSYGDTDTFESLQGGNNFEGLGGTRFNDYLVSAGNPNGPNEGNSLTGFAGDDTLVGSAAVGATVDYSREGWEQDATGVVGTRGIIVNLSDSALTGLSGVATGQTADTLAAGQALDTFGDTDTLVNVDGIQGTQFNDYIVMPTLNIPGHDISVDAGSGDDYVDLGSGNSHVSGGDGNDTLVGGAGVRGDSNFYDPGAGNDLIIDAGDGSSGEYDNLEYYNATDGITVTKANREDGTVDGGASVGHDVFSGIEIVVGSDLADTFIGSDEDDDFTGNAGNDTFNGGGGNDKVGYDKEQNGPNGANIHGIVVNLTGNNLTIDDDLRAATGQTAASIAAGHAIDSFGDIDTLNSIEHIQAGSTNDYIAGSNSNSDLQGGAGDDTLIGGSGSDDFSGGQGNDIIDGGAGHDGVHYDNDRDNDFNLGPDGVIVNLSGGDINGIAGVTGQTATSIAAGSALDTFGDTDTLSNIEHVDGTQYADFLASGGPLDNDDNYDLIGHAGNDTLVGGNGNTYFEGDAGDDSMAGGAANDGFVGGSGNDTMDGGDGHDDVRYSRETEGNTDETGTRGVIVNLGTSQLIVSGNTVTGVTIDVTVNSGQALDSFGGTDTLISIENVEGTQFNDYLQAGDFASDNDFELYGGDGDDTLIGGAGHDGFDGGAGNDLIEGGGLYDYINGSTGNDTIDGGSGGGTDEIAFNDDEGNVGDHIDVTLNGANSSGTITGTYQGGAVSDTFTSVEQLSGTDGNDTFTVTATFHSNEDANSTFFDGRGDIVNGGGRVEQLTGGAGHDSFIDETNATTANGGSSMVDYNEEKWTHNNGSPNGYDGGHEWGGATGEHGVVVNMSASSETTSFNLNDGAGLHSISVASGAAFDTFGDTDSISGIEAFRLTDAADAFYAGDLGVFVDANDGADTLIGGIGNDQLNGGGGNDSIVAGGGNDTVDAGIGDDSVNTGAGDDFIRGSIGSDTIDGGTGYDTIYFDSNTTAVAGLTVTFNAPNGSGTITGTVTQGDDQGDTDTGEVNDGFANIERVYGSSAADVITVSSGFTNTSDAFHDTIDDQGDSRGSGGDIEVSGGAGGDSFTDNSGVEGGLLFVDYRSEIYQHPGYDGGHSWGTQTGEHGVVVNLTPYNEGFTLDTNDGPIGGVLAAGTGYDTFGDLDSYANVTAVGLTDANDIAYAGLDGTTIYGYGGDDGIYGSIGDDLFIGGAGNDTMDGGPGGFDEIDYGRESGVHGVFVNLSGADQSIVANVLTGVAATTLSSGQAIDSFGGTDQIDNIDGIIGTSSGDVIYGGGPSDPNGANLGTSLVGLQGDDTLVAAGDNDTIIGGQGNDSIEGGDGSDTVDYGAEAGEANGATLNGIIVNMSAASVTVAANTVSGIATAQTVAASHAIDSFGTTDTLANIENIRGTSLNDYIVGSTAGNGLYGGDGNDTLASGGGSGIDAFIGGAGNDTFVLGVGDDVYVTDFTAGGTDDAVDLTAISGVNSLSAVLSHLDNDSNTTDAAFTFGSTHLTLQGVDWHNLTAADFILSAVVPGVVVNGTAGADTVDATHTPAGQPLVGAGDDTILGNNGNDNLSGLAGNDSIDGGAGNDTMIGGTGDDIYVVNATGDVVVENPGEGNDTVQSSITFSLASLSDVENVTLTGTGNLNATGNGSNNVLTGNAGNNSLNGGAGADTMIGGAGNDTYVVDNAGDTIVENAGEGTDLVQSIITFSLATLSYVENLTLTGTDSVNATGNDANNVIVGNAGDNVIDGGLGADSMSGGLGNDTYIVDNAGDTVTETGVGTDQVLSSVSFTLGTNIENLTLTGSGNISGTGNTLANVVTGNSGDNTLDGGSGADTLIGGGGNDTFKVDNVGDVVTGGSGNDTVISAVTYSIAANLEIENLTLGGTGNINATGNTGSNVLTGNAGNNSLNGGAGADTMIGGAGNDTYVVDDAGDTIIENSGEGTDLVQSSITFSLAGLANVENLTLTGADAINATGNDANNVIVGNGAANVIDGGLGADSMSGGAGDDTYIVDNTADTVTEGAAAGTDQVLSSVSFILGGNIENLTLTGSDNINGTGNTLANVITGNSGDNTLSGGSGADALIGGGGNDTFIVDNVGDVVTGGSGIDTVVSTVTYSIAGNPEIENLTLSGTGNINGTGNAGDNIITGTTGNNSLSGGDGNDSIVGGGGNDTLDGGNDTGGDTMIGGAGNDTYVVNSALDQVIDIGGTDVIQSSINFDLGSAVVTGVIETLTLTGTGNINGTGTGGNDTINGNVGDNSLSGGAGNDSLVGNGGNDTLDGGAGTDTMVGGAGNDTYYVDDAGDVVTEGANAGTDTVHYVGIAGAYTLGGNVENLIVDAAGGFSATGNTLANVIIGNNDGDTLNGGSGADTLTGGTGNDTYFVDNVGDLVTDAGGASDTVSSAVSYTLQAGGGIENLILTGTAASGIGNELNNTITGDDAANTLNGGTGLDTLAGGLGNDTYIVDGMDDVVAEAASAGTDTVIFNGTDGTYVLADNLENLTLGVVAATAYAINGTGNALNNVITGNAASNVIDGGAGSDSMAGGAGNDTYYADSTTDVVTEALNAGTDTVHFTGSSGTYTLGANVENLFLDGTGDVNGVGSAVDNMIVGNSGNNSLSGGAGNDTLDGGAGGNDSLTGGAGDDTYIVRHAGDVVSESGGSGTDSVQSYVSFSLADTTHAIGTIENLTLLGTDGNSATGNSAANQLIGNSGANNIFGGAGSDLIIGGDGNDTLDGGLGHDSLFGGNGNDVFAYTDADFGGTTGSAAANSDQIFDLSSTDSFDLTALISGADLTRAGGSIDGAIRITGSDGSFHIELNEGAVLHNQTTPDWSDAFDITGAARTDMHITIGADTYHWDGTAHSGTGGFVHD